MSLNLLTHTEPGFELTGDAVRAIEVAGVDEGVQAVGRVVGDPHCFGVIAEPD